MSEQPMGGGPNQPPHGSSQPRPLYVITAEIRGDWKRPYFGAVPYIDAMGDLTSMGDMYGADSADSIVMYFLSNAASWRGTVARRVKTELLGMVKDYQRTRGKRGG